MDDKLGAGMKTNEMNVQNKGFDRSVVLCIDDEAVGLKLRSKVLELQGYNVLQASSGAEGLALFRSANPDLVVMDQSMPGMNGDEVAAQIRRISPATPLILLSACFDLPRESRSLFNAFVSKGESPANLLRQMHQLLS
jgi:CheY-like chemotaxis protein